MRYAGRVLMFALGAAVAIGAQGQVTMESLLGEMTDLTALTRFPDPAYTVKQFSSYDRRSLDPAVLTDENWFANGDRGQHLRQEERDGATEWVLMDADGPGAIVRFWSANPADAGIVRIYVDGNAEPAIEMPLTDMLGGTAAPFVKPIAGERSQGWNSYLPIPYAQHCKVTTSQPDFYYQINYRTYADGTRVRSYSERESERAAALVESAAAKLASPADLNLPDLPKQVAKRFEHALEPGASGTEPVQAPGALYALDLRVEADDLEAALRGCLFEISFDGLPDASVVCPLGDFFGTAPGPNPYASLPLGVNEDGTLYCRWVMPFQRGAELRFTNTTHAPLSISGTYVLGSYEWTDASMYFHATWRSEYPVATQPRQDWTYVDIDGQGRFVGDMLHITNPVKAWWGEGDEKIYVDNEDFPSHFGTGTEDYYGYAWCSNIPFTHAYHNQPRCDGPANHGQTCVSRFHIIDNIPFTKAFKFDMEVWHWEECEIAMAATSYWYAMPGATHSGPPIDTAALKIVTPPPAPAPKVVEGALEGESLKVVEHTGGNAVVQSSDAWEWSREQQLWWRDGKPGDRLTVEFPVEKAGRYDVRAVFTKAVDYGIMRLLINGEEVNPARDFYNNGVIATPEESFGTFELKAGANTFTAEIVGANAEAIPGHMFGLDYLLLVPAE
ncbi:MAG: hypothetical protein AMXMBFR82_37390 [Candidatus Hydrogenedentota bacterium]